MQTSYFGNMHNEGNYISIARRNPDWFEGRTMIKLAPDWSLIKAGYSRKKFEYEYRKRILEKLDPAKVYEELGEDAILLCWEKPQDFCHREVVADWLEENIEGLEITETGFEDKITRKKELEEKGHIKPQQKNNVKLVDKNKIMLF